MRCIALNQIKTNVVGVVPACRNMISPDAFVSGDVVTSKAGKTIQVLNTDAEGCGPALLAGKKKITPITT
jgi:leucyl aminopeptidase